jgi:hypothetical protein
MRTVPINREEILNMPKTIFLDAEKKLKKDHNGSYRAQLIHELEKQRDEFASAKQVLLPPEEYDLADALETAVNTAIDIIRDYKAVESNDESTAEEAQEEMAVPTMISC